MDWDWYPWYLELYDADAGHLTCLEDGAYRRLIDRYMRTRSPLPDDDAALARFVGLSIEEWQAIAPKIRIFFKPSASRLHHKRCNLVLADQDKRSNKRSESASHAAKARWRKQKDKNADGMPNASEPHAEGNADDMPAVSDGHADRNAESMRNDATRQDKTRQSKKEERAAQECAPHVDGGSEDFPLSQAKAPDGDWSQVLFRQGLSWLAHGTGKPHNQLRSVVGKWLRDMGGDHRALFDIFVVADRDAIAAPIDWITKVVGMRAKQMQRPAPSAPAGYRSNGQGPRPRQWSVAERVAKIAEWKMQNAAPAAVRARVAQEGLSDVWGDG